MFMGARPSAAAAPRESCLLPTIRGEAESTDDQITKLLEKLEEKNRAGRNAPPEHDKDLKELAQALRQVYTRPLAGESG